MDISECRVLVVDDEVDLADLVAESFELEGFNVDKTLSGEEALEMCRSTYYDVILSDHHMTGIDGLELFERLRNLYSKKFLFYLCTGDTTVDTSDFKFNGGTEVVSKPYDLFELIARIGKDIKERV